MKQETEHHRKGFPSARHEDRKTEKHLDREHSVCRTAAANEGRAPVPVNLALRV
ncbi:MAG: hypothetical protein OXF75_03875 [Acidimicrobiaceae bacterium]|nr:hypothetical protein [Acidimicrobiaceae bacterium]